MRKRLLPLAALLLGPITYAQVVDLPIDYVRNENIGNNDVPDNVEGNKYLNENFVPATVIIDGKPFETYVRFNGYNDNFEIRDNKGEITTLIRRPNVTVTMEGNTYRITPFLLNGNQRMGYLIPKNEGDITLFLRKNITFRDEIPASTAYGRDKPAAYVPEENYYLQIGERTAEPIRLVKKDILKLIDSKEADKFVKDNKLKLKSEDEVIQLLNHINTQ